MKKTAIVIRALPFNTMRNSEALRSAVGLTLAEDLRLQIIFMDDGVWTAGSLESKVAKSLDLDKHIETLKMMDVELIVEEEALTKRGLFVADGMTAKPREIINQTIKDADVVISF